VNRGFERRARAWSDDVRGGISAIILEAVMVVVLVAFAALVAFLAVTVV
jgi:hypothetical protein